ncbi:O-methyltransferase [Pendulispora rubella]|uniref:O-methyltransferase n=1 Tax=Pendulispora rubella TaxID=2741070 RepID=A0ABZ2LFA2_9BACT
MTNHSWAVVDEYIANALIPADAVLDATLKASVAAGLPEIQVSPAQGKFLHLLARIAGAKSILEVGTLGGYSTIWLARALPANGRLVTLEADAKHAEVARANFARAGLDKVIDLRLGLALETLPKIEAEKLGPFDLVFIDADKTNNVGYFDWALKLARRGTIIVVDNVVRQGAVVDATSTDAAVRGVRRLYERLSAEKRVSTTALQTVGIKGYDGFVLALVE